ncbi:sugar kinase [Pseudoflavonifractor sp. 60]|uniref:sugar kinase n=1 Tax=Pseudoflavonifractor sp. 60 TaxID=2304576 RepID=UPI00136BCAFD|nr:sugar kinase [Pseudoflavonifractor sp. 60]NBI67166.1 sugar kinase [Pseudoflavonifractor sp. 60]
MSKVFVGFGEILVRLAPGGYLRFPQADNFNVNYTGAEGNMAIALSYMGVLSKLVTKLPDNEIGRCAMRKLAAYGVDTSHIVWGGERIGVYYLERGASQRPSKIIYDRAGSAISEADPGEFDWDDIFKDAGWFHFTGITAGLSDRAAECCRQACRAARRHGVKVSCDLNYRKYLWTPEKAQAVMRPMMEYVDVLIANEEDSDKVLGIRADGANVDSGSLDTDSYACLAKKLSQTFGFEKVAITLRESISASVNGWSGILCDGTNVLNSKKYTIQLVDRVGGGDSFASGLIYGFLNGMSDQETLEYAVAASCLKQTIEFDFNLSTVEEVKTLMNGNGSGRVVR